MARPMDQPAWLTGHRWLLLVGSFSRNPLAAPREPAGAAIFIVRSPARLTTLLSLPQQREDEGHAGPFPWLAFGLNPSAVGFGYGLGYGEAQAVARLLDAVQPVEALEDVR